MSGSVGLRRMEVERQTQPLSIDVLRPRFSWVVDPGPGVTTPTGSRVVVLDGSGAPVWDQRSTGAETTVIPDMDLRLVSLADYAWRVETTVETAGGPITITASARFGTGILDVAGWADAQWVGGADGPDPAAPLLRRLFNLPAAATRARLAVGAGGYAKVAINGVPVSDEVLGPGFANYDHRVPYTVHDVIDLLVPGENVLTASLGRGFFGMTTENTWNWHRAAWHAEPCLRALLLVEQPTGTLRIGTDGGMRTIRGGTRNDSLYEGEIYDQRLEPAGWRYSGLDDGAWSPATVVVGPRGAMRARPYPGIRVLESVPPVTIVEGRNGRHILDFGRQLSGWVTVRPPADTPPGTTVTLTLAERLRDGEPSIHTSFSAGELQTDRLICTGELLEWAPSFTYKGFQYAGVEGWPSTPGPTNIVAQVVHTDLERRARFACSDELLTWMHNATVATVFNNLHHIPTDTPVFEKNGWTGDARLGAEMMLRDLDAVAFLEDWCRSLSESRDSDGRPALIAPSPGWIWPGHMESPPWHSAYVMIPWYLHQATGDLTPIREHAAGIFRYLRLEHALATDGLSHTGLGDYLSPDRSGNPDEDLRVCATVAVYECTLVAAAMARLLGDPQVEREMTARAQVIRGAFLREFYDPDEGVVRDCIAGYRQTHNVLALDAGLIPPDQQVRVAAALARNVDEDRAGHLWVGALGARRALQVLDRHGHAATAFRAATAEDFPSWGWWRAQGATTMWEYWDDERSRNHYFFGTVDDWLFSNVAGISAAAPGYRDILVEPKHLTRLDWAEAEVDTVRGLLRVSWTRDGGRGVLQVDVPAGATATLSLPGVRRRVGSGRAESVFELLKGTTT